MNEEGQEEGETMLEMKRGIGEGQTEGQERFGSPFIHRSPPSSHLGAAPTVRILDGDQKEQIRVCRSRPTWRRRGAALGGRLRAIPLPHHQIVGHLHGAAHVCHRHPRAGLRCVAPEAVAKGRVVERSRHGDYAQSFPPVGDSLDHEQRVGRGRTVGG